MDVGIGGRAGGNVEGEVVGACIEVLLEATQRQGMAIGGVGVL